MQTFPKSSRLLKKSEFQRAYHKGIKLSGIHLLIYSLPTSYSSSRLGISVPKKFGKSHDRNYFKRLIREFFRRFPKKDITYDLHVIPRNEIIKMNPDGLFADFLNLMNQLDLKKTKTEDLVLKN